MKSKVSRRQINHLADAAAATSIVANAAVPHDAKPHTLFGAAGPSSCIKPVQHPACGTRASIRI